MIKEDRKLIQHISNTLDEVLAVLKKPENKYIKALEFAGTVVSVLAVISIVETILRWIFGG